VTRTVSWCDKLSMDQDGLAVKYPVKNRTFATSAFKKRANLLSPVDKLCLPRFIGLAVFGSRNQAKDHGLRTVQRTAYPT